MCVCVCVCFGGRVPVRIGFESCWDHISVVVPVAYLAMLNL